MLCICPHLLLQQTSGISEYRNSRAATGPCPPSAPILPHWCTKVRRPPTNRAGFEQEIPKCRKNDCPVRWAAYALVCCKSTWSSWNGCCAPLLNPHNINGLTAHQDELPPRLPLHLWLRPVTAFIPNSRFREMNQGIQNSISDHLLEGGLHTWALI